MARKFFTYLSESPSQVAVIAGDARLSLAKGGGPYDILVLDAFVGGAIPLHLLTEEAFRIYQGRLSPAGVILVHVTNRFLDLRPVLAAAARSLGWGVVAKRSDPARVVKGQEQVSSCVVLSPDRRSLLRLERLGWKDISDAGASRPWTDSLSSVWSALR
jgi:spermidine synthase